MLKRICCFIRGHGHGPFSSIRCEVKAAPGGGRAFTYFCGVCGGNLDSFSLVRKVDPAHAFPRGYGVAWVRWQNGDAVVMPVPLNVVAAGIRRAWYWLKMPRVLYRDPRQAYDAGMRDGIEVMEDQIAPARTLLSDALEAFEDNVEQDHEVADRIRAFLKGGAA